MIPILRKANTEAFLQREGIPYLPSLPCIESESETKLRSAKEIGIRIACLFCVSGTAFQADDSKYKEYLKGHSLWEHLSPDEAIFLSSTIPERRHIVNFSWRCEALTELMWTARLFDQLPVPRNQTDTDEIVSRFPAIDESSWPFIESIQLRTISEVLDHSDLIYRLHWATRQAEIEGKPPPSGLNPGVVREWHHAINWVTCYEDLEWDDVTTDT